jgi:hypothetical protein
MPTNNGEPPCPPLDRYRNPMTRFRDCSPGQLETTVDFTGTQGDPGRTGPPGPPGLTGPAGPKGDSSVVDTTCSFIMPAANANVTVAVSNAAAFDIGMNVYIHGAGFFLVQDVDYTLNNLFLLSMGVTSVNSAPPGTTVPIGSLVVPTGPRGIQGLAGLPSWTQTMANFQVPPPGQSVTIAVENTDWMVLGAQLWIQRANSPTQGATFKISQILDRNTLVITNTAT